jgi:hypothetical protein
MSRLRIDRYHVPGYGVYEWYANGSVEFIPYRYDCFIFTPLLPSVHEKKRVRLKSIYMLTVSATRLHCIVYTKHEEAEKDHMDRWLTYLKKYTPSNVTITVERRND